MDRFIKFIHTVDNDKHFSAEEPRSDTETDKHRKEGDNTYVVAKIVRHAVPDSATDMWCDGTGTSWLMQPKNHSSTHPNTLSIRIGERSTSGKRKSP